MSPSEALYFEATKSIGIKELPGKDDNPEIMQFFSESGHEWVNSEETPWCSAALNAWCSRLQLPSTGSLRARSWLHLDTDSGDRCRVAAIGQNRPEELQVGDIVVLWRERRDGPKGHVGLFAAARRGRLYLLGGNQGNQVCTRSYPRYRFLAGRRFV